MTNFKNKFILVAVISSVLLTTNVQAASFVTNDAENLTQCRALVKSKIGEVDRIKTSNIKSKARSFSVKYKVTNKGERSLVQCILSKGKDAEVSCLKGNACVTL